MENTAHLQVMMRVVMGASLPLIGLALIGPPLISLPLISIFAST